ncbi:hypothetical protein NVP1031O_005 [Vibrio phage 1.031.O._10N.261.46.F8]|nr:hypothetical protein NVP1031O_005 [Vibrio phage 1.031.O._10N.261.46.F8]
MLRLLVESNSTFRETYGSDEEQYLYLDGQRFSASKDESDDTHAATAFTAWADVYSKKAARELGFRLSAKGITPMYVKHKTNKFVEL